MWLNLAACVNNIVAPHFDTFLNIILYMVESVEKSHNEAQQCRAKWFNAAHKEIYIFQRHIQSQNIKPYIKPLDAMWSNVA